MATTVEAFAKALPPGAMNFVSGRGRDTMPHLMKTGDIDALAFIGGSKAADDLIRQHPQPHRLKVFLQLEAKNMGVSRPCFQFSPMEIVIVTTLMLSFSPFRFFFQTCLNPPRSQNSRVPWTKPY